MPVRTTTFGTETLTANDLNSLAGAWNSYTPTLAQGASSNIAKTITYAKYLQFGKLVICQIYLVATGAGTAGSDITVTLPVTAARSGGMIGTGAYVDAGFTVYAAIAVFASTTTVTLQRNESGAGIGTDPNIAVASGDSFQCTLLYEAA